jgi:DNA polymerase III delta prime subunit
LQSFEIKPIYKRDVAVRLATIHKAENVQFTTEAITFIVTTYYPDIRKVINFAQQSAIEQPDGTRKLRISRENAIEVDAMLKLVELLQAPTKAGVFDEVRKLISDMDNNSLETVYRYLLDHIDEYAKGKEALIILELSESLCQSQLVITAVKDIPMLACLLRILKHLK